MTQPTLSRDDLAAMYLDQLPFAPYPVQEEALLGWYTAQEGLMVCAPTGTGKTIIAEAALFEALHTGKIAYYTTPLIALTEQKFREMQDAAERWGFSRDEIGLVTGNRHVNPHARILVVVAEILLNRLLHRGDDPSGDDPFENVAAVVMDEFHSFNDAERGVVWELSLALLPKHVRLLLLSATVGNTAEFLIWLQRSHGRRIDLVQSTDRKIPLHFDWVSDLLLNEQLELMCQGDGEARRTPALLFCFNRAECWSVAEQLKGKAMLGDGQQKKLAEIIEQQDWKLGVGPKLKQILMRGVGVHHAGLLPKYRRRVEELFQKKLLSVCVCTETLASGINLPARSVVLTELLKGPPGKKVIVDASTAHQIFGRAGRPQFDSCGFVYALAHEDDVKINRWKKQYDQIPENTKDPNLIRAKKNLKKKMPTRRSTEQYWNEQQYQKLITAPPVKLASRGQLPWRLLAYLLKLSPDVERLRRFVRKRLLDSGQMLKAEERLTVMLMTLWSGGYIELDPPPPAELIAQREARKQAAAAALAKAVSQAPVVDEKESQAPTPGRFSLPQPATEQDVTTDDFGAGLVDNEPDETQADEVLTELPAAEVTTESELPTSEPETVAQSESPPSSLPASVVNLPLSATPAWLKDLLPKSVRAIQEEQPPAYQPKTATPTAALDRLLVFRSVNPLYGDFLLQQLGIADQVERIQALESVLEIPSSLFKQVRAPGPEELPPGPLATARLDKELLDRGLASPVDLDPSLEKEDDTPKFGERPPRRYALPFADKLRRLFDSDFPDVGEFRTLPVWVVGDLLHFGGDFQKYVTSQDLTKQEGLIFRHIMRMILLCSEFSELTPPETTEAEWRASLRSIADQLTVCCRVIDPESTDQMLETMKGADVTEGCINVAS